MQAERFDGAGPFLEAVGEHLTSAEAANNLILGVARRLAEGRRLGQGEPLYAAIRDDGGAVVGAALWTPPLRMMLSLMPSPAAAKLAEGVWTWGVKPTGAVGPADSARPFCERLAGQTSLVRSLRVFELRAVTPPPAVAGEMRPASDADRELAVRWFTEFKAEAHPDDPAEPRETAATALEEGRLFVWDHGGPVSMAAVTRTLAGGSAVGFVYSPASSRRKGYATALVAALSQKLLDGGASFCCLFTNLGSPTANALYEKIGYRPVCDFVELDLAGA